jgi:hypothetical protein
VHFISGSRQRDWLPCVFYRAHGKEKTHGKQAFCRAPEKTHGKDLFSHRPLAAVNKQVEAKCFRRAFLGKRTAKKYLCSAFLGKRTAKILLCRAFLA